MFATAQHILGAVLLAGMAALTTGCRDGDIPANRINRVAVIDAYVPEPVGSAAAIYMTLRNDGPSADRLMSVRTEVATSASLHSTSMESGRISMRPIDSLDVPAGGEVRLAPGGNHVMLTGLQQELRRGGRVPITLTFRDGGEVSSVADVVPPGGLP